MLQPANYGAYAFSIEVALKPGVEQVQSPSFQFKLSSKEAERMRRAFKDIPYDPTGSLEYISAVRRAAYHSFPISILRLLEQQRVSLDPRPYFIVDGLPVDDGVFGSPKFHETGRQFKSGVVSENVLAAFGALIGEPYSVVFEGNELVNNLTPQKDRNMEYTGLGSEVELDYHIENAALRFLSEDDCSPLGLFLLGIRYDQAAPKTGVSDAREALKLLSEEEIELLYGPHYVIRLPYRWRGAFQGATENTGLCPILSGPRNLPRVSCVFYPGMILAVNDRARQAMEKFHQAIRQVSVQVDVVPGRLVYIDNRFAMHSRDRFKPSYDENGCPYRWLQRLFVTQSLWNFRSFQSIGSRIVNPIQTRG
jgi:hypothetical protein